MTEEYGLEPEALIFDDLTFTLATGDPEFNESAIETIEGIRLIEQELPGVRTILGVSNVSFGLSPAARRVLNAVFLYHCIQAGLDLAIIHPSHVLPLGEIPTEERDLAEDLIFFRRPDALQRYIEHFEGRVDSASSNAVDAMADMDVSSAFTIGSSIARRTELKPMSTRRWRHAVMPWRCSTTRCSLR